MTDSAPTPEQRSPSDASVSTGPLKPLATEKQIKLLRTLGIKPPPTCTLIQASALVLRAQNARFYAWRIAKQEWAVDLDGHALRSVLVDVLRNPQHARAIVERMDSCLEGIMEAAEEGKGKGKTPKAEAYAPEFKKDDLFAFVRASIVKHNPRLARAETKTVPVSVNQIKEEFKRIRDEGEPRFYIGQDTIWDQVAAYRRYWPLVAGAAGLILVLSLAILSLRASRQQIDPAALYDEVEQTDAGNGTQGEEGTRKPETPRFLALRNLSAYRNNTPFSLVSMPGQRADQSEGGLSKALPNGGRFQVDGRHEHNGEAWYRVVAYDETGLPLGSWWLAATEVLPGSVVEITLQELTQTTVAERPTPQPTPEPLPTPLPTPTSTPTRPTPWPPGRIPPSTYTPSLDAALAEYALPDGKTLNQTVDAIRNVGNAKGLQILIGKPTYLMMDPRKPEFRVDWTIATKADAASPWTRLSGQWQADMLQKRVTPINDDAGKFATLLGP